MTYMEQNDFRYLIDFEKFRNILLLINITLQLVFTKADKMKPGGLENNLKVYKDKLLEYFVELPNIFVTSADNGLGKDQLVKFLEELTRAPLPKSMF